MRKALTDKSLAALKPGPKRYDVHDTICPGLNVRVSPDGGRVFSVKYRHGKKQHRAQIGPHPLYTLSEARDKARAVLRLVADGIDPKHRQRQPDLKVEAICRAFIEQYAKPRNRSWREAERVLERELIPRHGHREISEIHRTDIVVILDAVMSRGAGYQANRVLAVLRRLFGWCVERGPLDVSPINGLKPPGVEKSRERVLNDDEIRRILAACRNEAYPFRHYIPLLLATAQRRAETAAMRWDAVNLDARTWVIPSENAKNGKAHVVPLSDFAVGIIKEMPRFANSPYLFTTRRDTPISGFSKALKRISEASDTAGWRLHDLRRTAATGMARAGVAPHVVEKMLNHVSGTISGVAAVYNLFQYQDEKRAAVESWGQMLEALDTVK